MTWHSQSILSSSLDHRTFNKGPSLYEKFLELAESFSISICPFSASLYLQSRCSKDFAVGQYWSAFAVTPWTWGQLLPHSPQTDLVSWLMVPHSHTPREYKQIEHSHNEAFWDKQRRHPNWPLSLSEGRAEVWMVWSSLPAQRKRFSSFF